MQTLQDEQFNQELSKDLMQKLINIIDGNHTTTEEIQSINYQVQPMKAQLEITWKFSGDHDDDKSVPGGSYIGIRCDSISDLKNITSQLYNQAAFDKKLRASFVQNFKELGRDGIPKANNTNIIYDFGKFSVKDTCHTCHGKGNVRCSSCGGSGKQSCSHCGGSGNVIEYRYNAREQRQESYSAYCPSCSGSGSKSCSSCSGNGYERCTKCDGYGYFMITRNIVAQAEPSYDVETESLLANEVLQRYLDRQSIHFLHQSIYFEPYVQEAREADEETFIYNGKSVVLQQVFSVKSKEYTCYALSNPPHPFVRPTIFDDLFADELEFLNSAIGQKKHISKKKALEFFDTYSGQPVLDRAIKEVANVREKNNEDTTHLVFNACQGFISESAASTLSNHINKFMDKVSPSYSPLVWFIGEAVFLAISIIFFEYFFEVSGTNSILAPIISFLFVTLSIAGIVFPINLLVTWSKRRRIPIEYRQKLRHIEPFKFYMKIAFLIFVLSAGYGICAYQGYVPKTQGIPQQMLISNINNGCKLLKEQGYDVCQTSGLNKVIAELTTHKNQTNQYRKK